MQSIGPRSHDDRVLDAGMNEIRTDQFSGFDVEEGGSVGKSFGRAHEGVERDDFIAAQCLKHLDQIRPEAGVKVNPFSDIAFVGRRGGQRVREERDDGGY